MTTPTNALTYNLYIAAITNLAVVDPPTLVAGVATTNDPNFQALIPNMLDYAELRLQRDLDLLPLETERSYALTSGTQAFSFPVADFVTIRTILVNGVPLLPVTKEYCQNVYGTASTLGPPQVFAMYGGDAATAGNTSNNIILGPPPDQAYPMVVTGTTRAPSLYLNATTPLAATATTFISTWLPDLLIQASMIYLSLYQRNYLPTSNDPQMMGAFESQYQTLMNAARTEELRKRFSASAWSSLPTSAAATPTR
jgi:hypothetical protein